MGLVPSSISGCFGCHNVHAFTLEGSPHGARHQHTRSKQKPSRNRILFYEKGQPYYEFTNFSSHSIVFKGKRYPTSEHLFQAFKFIDSHPQIAEHIRTCSDKPMVVFDEAHKFQGSVRQDWSHVRVEKMEMVLGLKFTQHAKLRKVLLNTGDAELIEDSPRDWFWGVGADRTGSNELGKALMRLRDELRFKSRGNIARKANSQVTKGRGFRWKANSQATAGQNSYHLCEFCLAKPRLQTHTYCSRICADKAAAMCNYCRRKPKSRKYAYCSKGCANNANINAGQSY